MRRSRTLVVLVVIASILSLAPGIAHAQFENNTWYFGEGLGLDFSTRPPTLLRDGRTNSFEGSASISDPNTGKLLFYTDGVTVWNAQHAPMSNGFDLYSNLSSTQPAVIIPDPASAARYYIFTADQSGYRGAPRGINYSIVDMRVNNGLGDVIIKNSPLLSAASEKITAVKICNGKGYWVIAHEFNNNRFFAWKLDENGVELPVVSDVGSIHGPSFGDGIGWMSASPDGTMLALAFFERSRDNIEIFKFDPATGTVYSPLSVGYGLQPYGITFSPQSKKVYVTSIGRIEQFDVQQWNLAKINASWERLACVTQENGAIKIGPDGKLYVQHSAYLGVISQPELKGALCQYVERAIDLSSAIQWGLPNNVDAAASMFCGPPEAHIKTFVSPICESECVDFFDSSRFGATSWKWEFEGAQPAISTDKDPKNICFATAGTYKVTLTATNLSGSSVATATIKVRKCIPPQVWLPDTTICEGSCITFIDTSTQDYTRSWTFEGGSPGTFIGKIPPPICFDSQGKYKVKLIATNAFGSDTAIANVTAAKCPLPIARSQYDTVVCSGSAVNFADRSTNDPTDWDWQFEGGVPPSSGAKDPNSIVYSTPGVYSIRQIVKNANGSDTAFTQIRVKECKAPVTHLWDQEICQGDCIDLIDSSAFEPTSWKWSIDGPDPKTFTTSSPGKICFDLAGSYQLRLIASNAYGTDTSISTITVNSAAGWTTTSLVIASPLPLCSSLDTFITLYSGCSPLIFSALTSSNGSVSIKPQGGSIPKNDSVHIPVRIRPAKLGADIASLNGLLGSLPFEVLVNFTGSADPEAFAFGSFEGVFSTLACEPEVHSINITNEACAEQTIIAAYIEPANVGFTLQSSGLPIMLSRDEVAQLRVQYDASISELSIAELVIRTAGGIEKRIPLSGTRLLPMAGTLHFEATGPTTLTPNEPTSARISFDDAVESHLAPEEMEITFAYNTDVISASTITEQGGWSIKSRKEGEGQLVLRLVRDKLAITANSPIVEIRFNSFIAAESSTELRLTRVRCNPDDPDFELCVFDLDGADSSLIAILPICGSSEFQSALSGSKTLTVVVSPHPVRSEDDLHLTLAVDDAALSGLPLSVSLTDMLGKRTSLHDGVLNAVHQELVLPLHGIPAGVYVLRVELGAEHSTTTIVVE